MRKQKQDYSTASTKEKVAAIVEWLIDKKAKSVVALDLSKENSLSESVVIATAGSMKHGQGLAEYVLKSARGEHYEFLRMEGQTVGQWILLDFNDVVVHIFQPDNRELYRLDDMWPNAPVLADTRLEE